MNSFIIKVLSHVDDAITSPVELFNKNSKDLIIQYGFLNDSYIVIQVPRKLVSNIILI